MEYCPNGTIRQKVNLPYDDFINYARQMLDALAYCHANKIAHRDIKPDNIFIDQYNHIKLADFGFAKQFDDENKSTEKCGSLNFIAPEMFQYQEICPFKADIWALGVTFFFMATGTYPFKNTLREELKQAIIYGDMDFGTHSVNPQIRFLINKMTIKNPISRPTAEKLLKLPMFTNQLFKRTLSLSGSFRRNSYTTCSSHSNFNLAKAATFDQKDSVDDDKKQLPLLDVHSYRSIVAYPNIQRMSSRYIPTKQ